MFRRFGTMTWVRSSLILVLAGLSVPAPASAQGFESAVLSRARVFPEFGNGVVAMKRDAAGRYFVLATPPNVIWILSSDGKRIGQIPAAGSASAKIQYGVDFDLAPDGHVLVADRAANAIEVFSLEGALLSRIPVFAPTGVVALPNQQFAVTTLRSKRLVEIRNEDGFLIRSFGDPSDAGINPDSKQLQELGKISGDGAGDIFFAFTTLPDPTVRRYDRYGYVTSEATFDAALYDPSPAPAPDDRVQVGFNYSETSFTDSYNTWVALGNRGDVFFGGGLSPGLGAHLGSGPQTAQSATDNILATGTASGPGGGGPGGSAGGGMMSAQGSFQQNSLQLHVGGRRPHQGNSQGSDSSSDASSSKNSLDGSILQFNSQNPSSSDVFGSAQPDDSDDSEAALSQSPGQASDTGAAGARRGFGGGGFGGGGFGGAGFGPGLFSGFGGFGSVGGFGGPGSFSSRNSPQGFQDLFAPRISTPAPGSTLAAGGSTPHVGFLGHPGDNHYSGPHHFGEGLYNVTGSVKVNLDHPVPSSTDKPVLTAVGVDPVSRDIWAAIGKVLVHFDKNGNYVAEYFIATPEGAPLHVSAIVVEPDRLIVASDSRGIYEFTRFDRNTSRSSVRAAVAPQQGSQQNAAPQ
ncbi:MAG: hypothetical protein WA211_03235 [Candidatus Acidiferrales bacterium]